MWKIIQGAIVGGFVYWNMLSGWTTNMYLPVLIGVMVAYVLRLWWTSLRNGICDEVETPQRRGS